MPIQALSFWGNYEIHVLIIGSLIIDVLLWRMMIAKIKILLEEIKNKEE